MILKEINGTATKASDRIDSTRPLTPTKEDELELEIPCKSSTENLGSSDSSEESRLPPPLPCFDRRAHAPVSAPSIMQGILARARSSSPSSRAEFPRGRELGESTAMTQSMPNLGSTRRSIHNRGIGYSVLSSLTERGDTQESPEARKANVSEFEGLLKGL